VKNYAIVRCKYCSTHDCGDDVMNYRTVLALGKELEVYSVCRRMAWELEDAEKPKRYEPVYKKSRLEELRTKHVEKAIPPPPWLEELRTKHIEKAIPPPPYKQIPPPSNTPFIQHLSPSNLQPAKSNSSYTMAVIAKAADPNSYNTSGNEGREALKASMPTKEPGKSMVRRKSKEDDGLVVYYFWSTPSTKKALVNLVSDDNFRGQIKISEPLLQKAILKLSDEDVVSMKTELADVPGARIVIERAELRLQNAGLQEQLRALKKK